jgi:CRISPR-associated protein Cas2
MFVVISYDIPDDRRRARLSDLLLDYGQRAQKSVFESYLDRRTLAKLRGEVAAIIEPSLDDVRFYCLCENCLDRVVVLGKGQLSSEPAYFLA